jgi:hypothetical protein
MSDIVERLRAHVTDRGGASLPNGAWDMMLEAADEIERLTSMADVATTKQALGELLRTNIGTHERNASEIVDAIEALIEDKIAEAVEAMADRLEQKMGVRP